MFLKLYFIALPVFLALDALWLGIIAKSFYRENLGTLMKTDIAWLPGILVYIFLIGGLVFFAISPAIDKKMWLHALLAGAFFGFVTYATYDLTNHATIKNWPLIITIVDILWGTFIAATVSTITYFIASKLGL